MHTIVCIAPTCFGVIISPSSGHGHQNFLKTYSKKTGHNKHTYVMVPVVQNFIGFDSNNIQKYDMMLVQQ